MKAEMPVPRGRGGLSHHDKSSGIPESTTTRPPPVPDRLQKSRRSSTHCSAPGQRAARARVPNQTDHHPLFLAVRCDLLRTRSTFSETRVKNRVALGPEHPGVTPRGTAGTSLETPASDTRPAVDHVRRFTDSTTRPFATRPSPTRYRPRENSDPIHRRPHLDREKNRTRSTGGRVSTARKVGRGGTSFRTSPREKLDPIRRIAGRPPGRSGCGGGFTE